MKRRRRREWALLVFLPSALASVSLAGDDLAQRKAVIAGGTTQLVGEGFRVSATLGQTEAETLTGIGFRVQGGFWEEARAEVETQELIFANGFESP